MDRETGAEGASATGPETSETGISGGDAPRAFADGAEPEPTEGPAPEEGEWSPAKYEPETGIAIDGHGLPINHRLRAERLADDDANEDPAGLITSEHIADARERLDREREATPLVHANMKVKELERIAKREGVDLSTAKNNDDRVALIEAARGGPTSEESR